MNISQHNKTKKNTFPCFSHVRVFQNRPNPQEQHLLYEVNYTLGIKTVTNIKMVKLYRLHEVIPKHASFLAQQILCDRVHQNYMINEKINCNAQKIVEIAYKPGVMNPEIDSLLTIAKDLNINLPIVDISCEYHFIGTPTTRQIKTIIDRLLINRTVQYIVEKPPQLSLVKTHPKLPEYLKIRTMTPKQLCNLSKQRQLHLNEQEMLTIQDHFNVLMRNPTDAELETIAQTWSEHCYHKTFKAKLIVDGNKKKPLYMRLKTASKQYNKNVVSAFVDNAGAYRFYDGYAVLGKVETHNSPSAIEPYGGAGTGSGGVFRDIMGTGRGAKVIASTDMFCFGPPDLDDNELPPGCLPPHYLLRKVVAGVRDYGNRMGIPTNNGSVHFHKNFRAKPTVIVGAYGIAPEKFCHKQKPHPGDIIFTVGGKTGRDGIHGATFSSGQMTAQTKSVNASAVQIGNPIEEKRVTDALIAARDAGLIRTLTDCGAGGFSSAVGEMAENTGAYVDLVRVPLKYEGLTPWEIWISESQERMVCAIVPEHADSFIALCQDYNVQASNIGHFTETKQLTVVHGNQFVCDLSMAFLHHGLSQRTMVATKSKKELTNDEIPLPSNWQSIYCAILAHLNICSKEPIVRQYDHGVQGTNVLPPFAGNNNDAPNDAVVLRPLTDKPYGLIIAHGMNPQLNMIDPFKGSVWAITEALANLVAVGGNPKNAALIDNFIWPFPDEHSLWDLDQALEACISAMHSFELPFISGKDSLSSTYRFPDGSLLKIPPVLCISVFGKIKNITKTISADFKQHDSAIVLIGSLDVNALGGSCYADVRNTKQKDIPTINMKKTKKCFEKLYQVIQNNYIRACHDVSEGGIAVTLAEMCFGGDRGASVDVTKISQDRPDFALFNETAGCFLVEMAQENIKELEKMAFNYLILGTTKKQKQITVTHQEKQLFTIELEILRKAWQKPLKKVFRT